MMDWRNRLLVRGSITVHAIQKERSISLQRPWFFYREELWWREFGILVSGRGTGWGICYAFCCMKHVTFVASLTACHPCCSQLYSCPFSLSSETSTPVPFMIFSCRLWNDDLWMNGRETNQSCLCMLEVKHDTPSSWSRLQRINHHQKTYSNNTMSYVFNNLTTWSVPLNHY